VTVECTALWQPVRLSLCSTRARWRWNRKNGKNGNTARTSKLAAWTGSTRAPQRGAEVTCLAIHPLTARDSSVAPRDLWLYARTAAQAQLSFRLRATVHTCCVSIASIIPPRVPCTARLGDNTIALET